MTLMAKQWVIKQPSSELPNLPEYPPVILQLLALRGLTESEQINEFLNPVYDKLHDPFLFKDMQKAVERIRAAIERKEKITIYADYDADAITACAVLYLTLKKMEAAVDYYIPDRFTEGYGMNAEAVKSLAVAGTKLIVTVDCGINAVAEAEVCKQASIDLIITDHHDLTSELPDALAVINPKNPQDGYPFPYLTGVGVAFKLAQALTNNGWEKWLLDLVAIGTVADLQSLTGENRILVSFGLKVLEKTKWPGLRALLKLAGVENRFDAYTLGFIVAPRINAAGRIKHGNAAFELLTAEDPVLAAELAKQLDELNRQRQTLTDQILSEAKAQAEMIADKKVLLTHGLDWPKGVVGLAAGRLTETYNRPTLAISTDGEGMAVGSARSVSGFDIVAALTHAKEFLTKYGGHPQAAGFSLTAVNLPALHLKLLEYAEIINWSVGEAVIAADLELAPQDISWDVVEYLERFGPFGIGNPRPKFIARGLEVLETRLVGAQQQHLKLRVGFGSHKLEAIAFGLGYRAAELSISKKIDAVFELTANEWNGRKDMQLKISDLKLHE